MYERRVGRPHKGGAEVGKQGLIRMARHKMRERYYDIFLRKELAQACGVTPALITYYFKSVDEIFDEIIGAVIKQHFAELQKITSSDLEPAIKYQKTVTSLVKSFVDDINLFETFEHAVALGMCKTPDYVNMMQQELKFVVQECFHLGMPFVFGRDVFHRAVWGVCKAAAADQLANPLFPGTFLDLSHFAQPAGSSATVS